MQVDLHGGFGEKGRTSVALRSANSHILLDVGIKVGASGREYYPAIDKGIETIDALLLSHAHEDHVGALSWFLAQGYSGPIYMTEETRDEAPATLAHYADAAQLKQFPFPRDRVELFRPGDTLTIGDFTIRTGRSGHVVGGVWFAVGNGQETVVYAGDVLPDSKVFVMDPLPSCDLLILDASYGADPVSGGARADAIATWIAEHPKGCLLPTPLFGRSLELLAIMPKRFAIHASMRQALASQIAATDALYPKAVERLKHQLASAIDWHDGEPLPDCPLLADDGMGTAGPSATLIPLADASNYPVLLTGHLPASSPGDLLYRAGRAGWIRMPTHPTLSGNMDIWHRSGEPPVLGHSCTPYMLDDLTLHIPSLRIDARTGQSLTLREGKIA
ncbi:MBL fold metallo-hydrolase [Microvirga sp. ACRRW]|nr:MBL fold metallo-hydrolase [Microvirga sp. ACRRW]MCG7393747.1 MBL fold metallo-hydrolase [Microvirga sp. ACRRW]